MSKLKKCMMIIALGLAGGSIYFLPYIKYIFYDAQIISMGITNTQLGYMMTMYTIGNTILYIPGGIIADRVPPRKALTISFVGTAILTLIYAFTMKNFMVSMVVWLGLSFSTNFAVWSVLLKSVRTISADDELGFMYGLYYACNGLANALTNGLALQVYKTAGGNIEQGFFRAMLLGAVIPIAVAVILFFMLKDVGATNEQENTDSESKFQMSDVGKLLKNPVVWIVSLIIFCGYGFYISVSYFNPYLTEIKGVSLENSGFLSIIRTHLLLLLAPLGGLIVDKVFKSTCKWLCIGFLILSALFGTVLLLPADMNSMAASIYSLIPGAFVMMIYSVISSSVNEACIPRGMTGTMIGIVSMVGYLPDSFYSILFGNWLDTYQGSGYNMIFGFLAITGIVGSALSYVVYRYGKKHMVKEDPTQL